MTDDTTDAEPTSRTDALDAVGSEPDKSTPGRRSVLRGAVAGVAASLGLTGTAAAIDPTGRYHLRRLGRRYEAVDAEGVFRARGREVLDLLEERGHVADADALAADLRTTAVSVSGTPTGRIEATREFGDGDLVVAVEPEADRAYAVVREGGQRAILDPSVEGDEVDTSACIVGPECMAVDTLCDSNCQVYEVHCCENDCFLGDAGSCCEGTCISDCTHVCN